MQDYEERLLESKNAPTVIFQSRVIPVVLGLELTICIVRLILACMWSFVNGIVFSILGILLISFGFASYQKYKPLPRTIAEFVNSRIFRIGFWVLSSIILFFVLILLVIQISAWDKNITSFPSDCEKTTNCCRITNGTSTDVNAGNNTAPYINGTLSYARNIVEDWINNEYYSDILKKTDTFIHARFLTAFWGFPDDFYVELACTGSGSYYGNVQIEVQSESRLGTSDFGVNKNRVDDFLTYVKKQKPQEGSSCIQ